MNTEKYEKLLLKKIKNQVVDWFDVKGASLPNDDEMFRFLHSVKGTAGTIGQAGLAEEVENLLVKVSQSGRKQWKREELRDLLSNLISYTYERENSLETRKNSLPLIKVISPDISEIVLLKEFLEKHGWLAVASTSEEKAMDNKPDCIVIDSRDKLDTKLIEKLSRERMRRFIPIVFISSINEVETRIEAYNKGADDFIAYPYHIDELKARIARQLERKKLFDDMLLGAEESVGKSLREVKTETESVRRTLFVSIIDDDAIIRSMLEKLIGRLNTPNFHLDIQAFGDGRKFFEADRLKAEGEHFIILDGVMPVMDGIEVLQKIRRESGGNAVKVLMLTGRKNEYDVARALKLGADDYVTKPFSITELEARINVLIQRRT